MAIVVPGQNTPLVDATTGNMTIPWFRFFLSLFNKTGQYLGNPLIAGNNLSDLGDLAEAQQNLGVAPLDIDPTFAADSDTRIASQKATKTYVDTSVANALRARFVSSPTALPSVGAKFSLQHGLGASPSRCSVKLHCTISDGNWNAGDEPYATSGLVVWGDALYVNVLVASGGVTLLNKNTGATFTITLGNWNMVLEAAI